MKILVSVCTVNLFVSQLALSQFTSRLDEIEQQIALDHHTKVLNSGLVIDDPVLQQSMNKTAARLSQTSYNRDYKYPTRVTYLQGSVNAGSVGAGLVYVNSGLVKAIHANDGVLAFVMGHEMAHNNLHHLAKKRLRYLEFDLEYRRLYRQNPNGAELYKITWQIAEHKIERDEENAADQLGMKMAAEAGYHPDYSILGARAMRNANGEQSKFMAFFADHPRWTTREQRVERGYTDANDIYTRLWPNPSQSPGGVPPPIAIVAPVRIEKQKGTITVSTKLDVRNLGSEPAMLSAHLLTEGQSNEQSIFSREYRPNDSFGDQVSFQIASTQLVQNGKKNSIVLKMTAGSETLYESGPVGLKSPHKVSNENKSIKASTSHSAGSVLASAADVNKGHQETQGQQRASAESVDAGTMTPDRSEVKTAPSVAGTANVPRPEGASTAQTTDWGSYSFSPSQTVSADVVITSNPSGAVVFISGSAYGVTPLKVRFAPSSLAFDLKVEKDGYETWHMQSFAVRGLQEFNADLQPTRQPYIVASKP